MKKSVQIAAVKSFFLLLFISVFQLVMWAQDQETSKTTSTSSSSKTSIDITDTPTTGQWYTSPWVWIVGAAVFILLLVALLSNRGTDRSDRVIVKKTVERDVDPDL
ncbi:MAG: hypothetical protein ACM3VS_18420 [Candidatus Dadabacteria bacterium]